MTPTSPNLTPGLFIDRDNRAPCNGYITHWRVCYFNPRRFNRRFNTEDTLRILLQTWHLKNKNHGSRISSYSTDFRIPQQLYDYQCVNITVNPADYIAVKRGHYIAVYIFNNSVLPVIANTTDRSSLYHFPVGTAVTNAVELSTADIISNLVIHVAATIGEVTYFF